MDEPRARSASRLADLPAGVELGEYYSRQVEARPFILHLAAVAGGVVAAADRADGVQHLHGAVPEWRCSRAARSPPPRRARPDILPHAGFVVCDIVFDALCLLHIGVTAITGYRNAQGQLQLRWTRSSSGTPRLAARRPRVLAAAPAAAAVAERLAVAPAAAARARRPPAVALPRRVQGDGADVDARAGPAPPPPLFAVLLPAHCFGCVWFALGHVSGFGANPWVPSRRLSEAPLLERYLTALWWGIGTLLGYYDGGEVPSELVEYFFRARLHVGLFINS